MSGSITYSLAPLFSSVQSSRRSIRGSIRKHLERSDLSLRWWNNKGRYIVGEKKKEGGEWPMSSIGTGIIPFPAFPGAFPASVGHGITISIGTGIISYRQFHATSRSRSSRTRSFGHGQSDTGIPSISPSSTTIITTISATVAWATMRNPR